MEKNELIIQSIRACVKGETPTYDISKILFQQRCPYLLISAYVENDYAKMQKIAFQYNLSCIRERYRVCAPVFFELNKQNIPYAVIKGAVLSVVAYGDVKIRGSRDVDILIQRENVEILKKILQDNGFVQGYVVNGFFKSYTRREQLFQSFLSHQLGTFVKKSGNSLCPYVIVDINLDIVWGESKQKTDMSFVLKNTEDITVEGVAVKKLERTMEFVALCLHHYKDMNSIFLLTEGRLNLGLFSDVYYYLMHGDVRSKKLGKIARALNVSEYIYYCIYYAQVIFSDPSLTAYLDELYSTKAKQLLNVYGLYDQERSEWVIPFEDRLFDENFKERFVATLTRDAQDKIKNNKEIFSKSTSNH